MWRQVCIQNHEFCIKNDEYCIKNDDSSLENEHVLTDVPTGKVMQTTQGGEVATVSAKIPGTIVLSFAHT